MTKTSLLILLTAAIFFAACKKNSPQPTLYYYTAFGIGQSYPASGSPADTIPFIDSSNTFYNEFRGDTIQLGSDNRYILTGSNYKKRYQNFEVYRYTK